VATRIVDETSCVVPVPGIIDAAVATSYLDRKYPVGLTGERYPLNARGVMKPRGGELA
jgi:hypothetical protein